MGLGSSYIIGQRGVIVALISRSRRAVLFLAALLLASPALAPRAEAFVFWTNSGDTIGRANLDGTGVDPSFITLVGANPYLGSRLTRATSTGATSTPAQSDAPTSTAPGWTGGSSPAPALRPRG